MTVILFSQQVPDEELGRRPASGRIEITRGQRAASGNGNVLLPGEISEILVSGTASITVEPTGADQFVQIEYKTLYPYTRFVSIPNSGNPVHDTDLIDVDLATLIPSVSKVAAWTAVVAQVTAAATEAGESAALATEIANGVIVTGAVVGDNLILERADGTLVDSGDVRGLTGPAGPMGAGILIQGTLADPADLPVTGTPGNGYVIGGDLYVWPLDDSGWVNAGRLKGDQGDAGISLTGPQGDSAYQVALSDGFVGTKTQWLESLRGPAGTGGGGTAVAFVRASVVFATPNLISGYSTLGVVPLALGYRLLKVESSGPARVRMYSSLDYQALDEIRAIGVPPIGDHGLQFEALFSSTLLALVLSPGVDGSSLEATPTSDIPITVQNTSSGAAAVSITFTWIETE